MEQDLEALHAWISTRHTNEDEKIADRLQLAQAEQLQGIREALEGILSDDLGKILIWGRQVKKVIEEDEAFSAAQELQEKPNFIVPDDTETETGSFGLT